MAMHTRLSKAIACGALLASASACNTASAVSGQADNCFILIAVFQPPDTILHVGDTVTFHAKFTGPADCLPADTTNNGIRWGGSDSALALDSMTGHAVAVAAGTAFLDIHAVGSQANLGLLSVTIRP